MWISRLLIAFGCICLLISGLLYWQRTNPYRLAFRSYTAPHNIDQGRRSPSQLLITSLKINLPIKQAKIEKKSWETTTEGVSWLSSSVVPGNKGNSILYGHNWSSLLGNLSKIKVGAIITILYNDGSVKHFSVQSISTVSPLDSYVLEPTPTARVTLYTCSGFLDSKRFVVIANKI